LEILIPGKNPDFIEKDSSQINDFDGIDLLRRLSLINRTKTII
jgi:hypothetical protein